MSVGSRTQDDRRRRRLAVTGDGAPEAGGLAVLRERNVDLPSASPWLPRSLWRRSVIGGCFWLGLIAVAVLLIRPFPPHPQLAPAIDHLTGGTRPVLGVYADIFLWSLAAELALLVGWFRSQSQNDFHGRYRLWAWAAIVFLAWGFCAGTDIHTAIGAVAGPRLRWPIWRAEMVVWLAPAMAAGLSVWWLVGRDLTRSRVNAALVRFAIIALLLSGAGRLYEPEMSHIPRFDGMLIAAHLFGMGLLITGLWLHAGYVAYVCADPPVPRASANSYRWILRLVAFLVCCLWPFRRSSKPAVKEEPEEPKRRRRTATKPKRRSRARVKPEVEETDEEQAEEETEEAAEESEEESWSEEEVEEPEPPRAVVPQVSAQRSTMPPPAPAKPAPQESSWSDDEDDDSDDETSYRVEGGHDPFKGLSKRQRRELKKQMREKERQQQRR